MSTGGTYGLAYTYEERHLMVRLHGAGQTCREIAEALSVPYRPTRTAGAIKTQLCNMGILNASMDLRNHVAKMGPTTSPKSLSLCAG